MNKDSLTRYPLYATICFFFMILGMSLLFLGNLYEWRDIFVSWKPLIFFVIIYSVGLFLSTKSQDPLVLALSNSVSFSAMLSFGSTFSMDVVILPLLFSVFFFQKEWI